MVLRKLFGEAIAEEGSERCGRDWGDALSMNSSGRRNARCGGDGGDILLDRSQRKNENVDPVPTKSRYLGCSQLKRGFTNVTTEVK